MGLQYQPLHKLSIKLVVPFLFCMPYLFQILMVIKGITMAKKIGCVPKHICTVCTCICTVCTCILYYMYSMYLYTVTVYCAYMYSMYLYTDYMYSMYLYTVTVYCTYMYSMYLYTVQCVLVYCTVCTCMSTSARHHKCPKWTEVIKLDISHKCNSVHI